MFVAHECERCGKYIAIHGNWCSNCQKKCRWHFWQEIHRTEGFYMAIQCQICGKSASVELKVKL